MGFTIEAADVRTLTDEQIADFHGVGAILHDEAHPEDPEQTLEMRTAFLRNLPDFVEAWAWFVRDGGGRAIGYGQAYVLRTGDNEHVLQCDLGVLPAHRRQGIGRGLVAEMKEVAKANGQTLLMGGTSERVPAAAAFAEAVGATAELDVHTNRLLLAELDRDMVDRWVAEGPKRAPGYSLVLVDGRYPDDLLDRVAEAFDVMNDAPRDGLAMGDQHLTGAQIRETQDMGLAQGDEAWAIFARHDDSGAFVGLTDVTWNPNRPATVYQGNTGVHRDHRGHALGKWLKAAMLQRILAERADVVDVRTGNADSNEAMLGINHELGFKAYIAASSWQLQL